MKDPHKKSFGQRFLTSLKRWFYSFLLACVFGAIIFALPGTLTVFGIGASAAAIVVSVAETLRMSFLISSLGVPGTLGLAAALAPAIVLISGIVRGIVGAVSSFVGLFTSNSRDEFSFNPNASHSRENQHVRSEHSTKFNPDYGRHANQSPVRRDPAELSLFETTPLRP